MRAAAATDIGLVRRRNEDFFLVDLARGLFVVADGMGGHQAGDIASRLAVETIAAVISSEQGELPPVLLAKAVARANEAVYHQAQARPDNQGMGTTLTAALVEDGVIYLAHVGDSRAYLLRQWTMEAITADHSVAAELARRGGITESEAVHHPQRNILTRALGITPVVDVDAIRVPLVRGDYLLLCTDGLYDILEKDEMGRIIGEVESLEIALQQMVALALQRGGPDNITAVLVHDV